MDFNLITSVRIELSNVCNLACHGCPITRVEHTHHLPFKLVKKVINELSDLDFGGEIGFHRYNEPLIDPRLFAILAITPFPVTIYTNGTQLTPELKKELIEFNCDIVWTDHTKDKLDPRLNIYKWEPVEPIRCGREHQLTVACTGDVVICCYDWKNTITFGNIEDEAISDIMKKIPYERTYDLCCRCNNWGGKGSNADLI